MNQREAEYLGFLDPVTAVVASFCFLGALLYKRVNLGITLNATALLLALLSLNWQDIPTIIYKTTDYATPDGQLTISVVFATLGIMWLSQLYKETRVIDDLSESLSRVIKNSKVILSVLPAIIGFLPVAGGALMSAPLVDSEAEKLKLKHEKKAYVNIWFRHTIFPVYPISQVLIITAALTGIAIPLIILRQIPVVIVMIIVGYLIGFWKVLPKKNENHPKNSSGIEVRRFLVAFSPILATILAVIVLDLTGFNLANSGFDVLAATFIGLAILIIISKPKFKVLITPLRKWSIYGVTLATYGAFLLRNVFRASGISEILKVSVTNGSVDIILFLTVVPAILGFLTGSPSGGVTISCSILSGILAFSPKNAALLYMSAYLGYVIAPTHLCFAFTADYFKCSLGKIYKYVIPSFLITYATALLIYFFV